MQEFLTLQGFAPTRRFKGKGCDRCRKTGYAGRLGIYELLVMDDSLRDMVTRNPDVTQLRKLCRERGLVTLREDGFDKVMKGLTTVDEILRVTENAVVNAHGRMRRNDEETEERHMSLLNDILRNAVAAKASDVHINVGLAAAVPHPHGRARPATSRSSRPRARCGSPRR